MYNYQTVVTNFGLLFFGLYIVMSGWLHAQEKPSETALVLVGERRFHLELAESRQDRSKGLMGRDSLCRDCGMVFHYITPKRVSFWMKNTSLALDVAFVDEAGKITQIERLEPLSEQIIKSRQDVKFAWEMQRGWFAENRLKVGDRISIILP